MIVTLGDAIVDFFAMPVGSTFDNATSFVPYAGGSPANIATVAARLGASVRFVGAVGTDPFGTRLITSFERANVDTRCIVRITTRTSVTFIRVDDQGNNAFLSYRFGGADHGLSHEALMQMQPHPLQGVAWLLMTTSAFAADPLALCAKELLLQAKEKGISIAVDLNVRPHLWTDRERLKEAVTLLANECAILKASEEDLAHLGVEPSLRTLGNCATDNVPVLILTKGKHGACAKIQGQELTIQSPNVKAVDSTGAGDAFMATILAGIDLRDDGLTLSQWKNLLSIACEMGALAVTQVGATEGVVELSKQRKALQSL